MGYGEMQLAERMLPSFCDLSSTCLWRSEQKHADYATKEEVCDSAGLRSRRTIRSRGLPGSRRARKDAIGNPMERIMVTKAAREKRPIIDA
jgi:hypothetical protein